MGVCQSQHTATSSPVTMEKRSKPLTKALAFDAAAQLKGCCIEYKFSDRKSFKELSGCCQDAYNNTNDCIEDYFTIKCCDGGVDITTDGTCNNSCYSVD